MAVNMQEQEKHLRRSIAKLKTRNATLIKNMNRKYEIVRGYNIKLEARLRKACEIHGHSWGVKLYEGTEFRRCVVCDVNFDDV